MGNSHRGFLLYLDNYELIEDLTKEEKGNWIDAIFLYKREGKITEFPKGSLIKTAFKVIKSQLDRDGEAWEEKCQKRAEAGRKGGLAKASNAKHSQAKASNAKHDLPNLADNVNDTDTDIVNDTETEQADAVSDSVTSDASAAATAEPQTCDLFSLKQLKAKVKQGKVKLTDEGIEEFYYQMQDDNWNLYDVPVEKRNILRVLREFAKTHPEYHPDEPEEIEVKIAPINKPVKRKTAEDYMRELGMLDDEEEEYEE